jgi:putative spermidine/putrescine transport system permease protein
VKALGTSWLALVLAFVYAPLLVVLGASVDPGTYAAQRAFLQFPPRGFTLHWYTHITPAMWEPVWLSVQLAAGVALAALLLGVPAAVGLVRGGLPGANALATLLRAPLQIPFIVTGVALLQAAHAVAGATGVQLHGSMAALFIGHLFVATPYVIGATGAALAQVPPRLEEAAVSLGATRWRAFRRATLPLIVPGVSGGAVFAFLVSFTDVTLALFLAPPGRTTFPVWVFGSLTNDVEASLPALSCLVFLFSAVAMLLLQRLAGLDTVLRSGGAKS